MPLRKDIHKVMVLGSGPIVIGQAAEFDYAGTQACRALREEGLEVVLVNSNPATIMTDKAMADKVYIEPMTVEAVQEIIKKEHPDSLLPNLGGQTGLNLAMELCENGFLEKMGVKLLGALLDFRRQILSNLIDVGIGKHARMAFRRYLHLVQPVEQFLARHIEFFRQFMYSHAGHVPLLLFSSDATARVARHLAGDAL